MSAVLNLINGNEKLLTAYELTIEQDSSLESVISQAKLSTKG